MAKFFGFAVADSMFSSDCLIRRKRLTSEEVRDMLEKGGIEFCLNPSHGSTIAAARQRFGLRVEIPEKPSVVNLDQGDSLLVMGVRGLPRLTDRHEYSEEEIASASFSFSEYTVL